MSNAVSGKLLWRHVRVKCSEPPGGSDPWRVVEGQCRLGSELGTSRATANSGDSPMAEKNSSVAGDVEQRVRPDAEEDRRRGGQEGHRQHLGLGAGVRLR